MIYNFEQGFNGASELSRNPRPLVAISANVDTERSTLHYAYSQAVVDAGATPIIIPANCDGETLRSLVRSVDALLLSGGGDIDARYFGEENIPDLTDLDESRDYYDFMLLRAALDVGLPVLGICRGCQVVNIALGGSIYQDLDTEYVAKLLPHKILENKERAVHEIELAEGSMLRSILGRDRMGVNSRHHQSIKCIAPQLSLAAISSDGVVEAVECRTRWIVALQCHPENMATEGGSIEMKRLFREFVARADLYRQAKEIHRLHPTMDSHCDTPMLYDQAAGGGGECGKIDFATRSGVAQVDLVKMSEGHFDSTITVAYIPQSTPAKEAFDLAISTLRRFQADLQLVDGVTIARDVEEILRAKRMGVKSVMLGVENGWALAGDLSNVERFKREGVIYITLCHNGSNDICDSAVGDSLHDGVSSFGESVIGRMNQLGVTIDISHASLKTVEDVLRLSVQPIIASHSSCRALCSHPRNLSDEMIEAIAARGGVVQVCGYGGFLRDEGCATILDLVAHIEHIIDLVGDDYVGVGSDFDGGGGVDGFSGANDFVQVSVELLCRGHKAESVAKVMGGNILRVLSSNLNTGSNLNKL